MEKMKRSKTDNPWRPAVMGLLLSSEFEGVLQPSDNAHRPRNLQERDWITAQKFWMLARRNTRLLSLKLSRGLRVLCQVKSDDFIQDVVAGLPELRELTNHFEAGDPHVLMNRLSHLETLCMTGWSDMEPSVVIGNLKISPLASF